MPASFRRAIGPRGRLNLVVALALGLAACVSDQRVRETERTGVVSSAYGACTDAPAPANVLPSYANPLTYDAPALAQNDSSVTPYDVLTQHNDLARTGAAVHENILTPASVRNGFGLLGSVTVQGKIYAQPLYVEQAAVQCSAGGPIANANVVYVATLENRIYAIDVDRRAICWETPTTLGCGEDGAPLLGFNTDENEGAGAVKVGIVSTPVIDRVKSLMYAVTRERDTVTHFYVNVIDTRTGMVVARQEIVSVGDMCPTFQPFIHNNRPGLVLVQDKLFVAFGSTRGENGTAFHGYVFGFDVSNPLQPTAMPEEFCSTGRGGLPTDGGGIWMSGNGIASDGDALYFVTGNGAYARDPVTRDVLNGGENGIIPQQPAQGDHPNSFVKLAVSDLAPLASYTDVRTKGGFPTQPDGSQTPYNFGPSTPTSFRTVFWGRERADADLGSGGALLVGDRVIGGGKDGMLYTLNRSLAPGASPSFQAFINADDDEGWVGRTPGVVRTTTEAYRTYEYRTAYYNGPNIHGAPVAWDVTARGGTPTIHFYAWSEKDSLKRFSLVDAQGTGSWALADAPEARWANPTPGTHGSLMSAYKSMPGGILSISANGAQDGIVWAVIEEPFPKSVGVPSDAARCQTPAGVPSNCGGCYVGPTGQKFVEYCDAFMGYVPGRLYAFAADDDGTGLLPILWGDRRNAATYGAAPNNFIPRYSKFTPPTIAHGKVVVATGNDEVRIYGLRTVAPPTVRRADLMTAWNSASSVTFGNYSAVGARPSPPANTTFAAPTLWMPSDGGWGDTAKWLTGDFDGDGLTDAATVFDDGGWAAIAVRRSTGTTFTTDQSFNSSAPSLSRRVVPARAWSSTDQWLSGDFDGDGRADVAVVWNDASWTSAMVYRRASTGTRFEAKGTMWLNRDGGWATNGSWLAGDFNGDGVADLAVVWSVAGVSNMVTVRQSTRSAFKAGRQWVNEVGTWRSSSKWLAGDFDGDGRDDLIEAWKDTVGTMNYVSFKLFRSVGAALVLNATPWASRDGGWGDTVKWVAADFTGDGKTDIATVWNSANLNSVTLRQSLGSTASTVSALQQSGKWSPTSAWLGGTFRASTQ